MWPWQGIVNVAEKYGANLVTYIGKTLKGRGVEEQANVIYPLARDERLDGLIIWKAGLVMMLNDAEVEKFITQYPVPIVTIEGNLPGKPCVTYENYQGMRRAVDHLVEVHGLTKIGFLGMYGNHRGFQDRYRGYVDALQAHGLAVDPLFARPWFDLDQLIEALIEETILDAYLDAALDAGLQAVIGVADDIAMQVQNRLQQRGVEVPHDVAVIGFDDFTASSVLTPPMTSVTPSWYELGQLAAETLLDIFAGKPVPAELFAPARLTIRQSCGCQDPCVELAGRERVNTGKSDEVISLIVETARSSKMEGSEQGVVELWEKFNVAIKGGEPGDFLKTLERLVHRTVRAGGSLTAWHNTISLFRQHTQPPTKQTSFHTRLLQQAQVLIGREAERSQAAQRFQTSLLENRLRIINHQLIAILDVDNLVDVLVKRLPGLGISRGYLALFEDPQPYQFLDPAPEWARLILAYTPQGRVSLEPGGQRFRAQHLLPDELWPADVAVNLVALTLYVHEMPLGFIVFDGSSRNGVILEALRVQISSALHGATLVQRVQERSDALARQQYILDTFMESVPDRIYFKDMQSRFTHVNKALVEKLGAVDAGELLGKSDFDFFPGEQAQEKYRQEQEILRTGQPLFSAEEPDGVDRWAVTTKMPLRDEKGQIIGTFGISRDVTELVKARQVAESAKNEAEKARQKAEVAQTHAERSRQEAEAEKEKAEAVNRALAVQMWQSTGQTQLNERMRGEQDLPGLATNVVQQLCEYLPADSGALYIKRDERLLLCGSYAYPADIATEVALGEGLLGQAAVSKKTIIRKNLSDTHRAVQMGLTRLPLQSIVIMPLRYEHEVVGVLGLGVFEDFTPAQMEFLNQALENITIAFLTAQARGRINELLTQTREQAAELQAQQEELRATNEELEAQTESLRASETRLRDQQSALEAANAELEEKTVAVQEKQGVLDQQNQELRAAQGELERKAEELAQASQYKSEFLANMSHELRTPLNSLLILAQMLANNGEGNLTEEQVESASIIHKSGADLLNLINEILDLSKVEAGRMEFHIAPVALRDVVRNLQVQFEPIAAQKGVPFTISVDTALPARIATDQQRVEQILKNLLSNAR